MLNFFLSLNPQVFVIFIFYEVACLCGIIFEDYILNYGKEDVTNVYNIMLISLLVLTLTVERQTYT